MTNSDHDFHGGAAGSFAAEGCLDCQAIENARCEAGWTGDRCDLPLFHDGPHSNERDLPWVPGHHKPYRA